MRKAWRRVGKSPISTGVAASYANTLVALATNLVAIPVYVRLLSKADYGLLLTVMSLTAYLPLLNLGISRTTSNRFAEAHAAGEGERANRILATGFWTYVRITAVALVVVLLAIWVLPVERLFRGYGDVTRIRVFVSVAAGLLLVELPLTIFPACLRATGHISRQQNLLSVQLLGRFAVSIVAVVLWGDITILVALLGVVNIVVDLVQWQSLRKRFDALRFPAHLRDSRLARELRAPSAYYLLLDVGSVVLFGCDAIVISITLGPGAVTSYVLAQRLVLMVGAVPAEIAHNYGPRFIRDRGAGDEEALQRDCCQAFCLCIWVGSGLLLLVAVLGRPFLDLWVGPSNYVGDSAFRFLLAMLALQVLLYPLDTLLVVLGRHKRYALGTAAEAVLNLTLSLILVRSMGVAGVALGTVLARLVTATPIMAGEASKVLGGSAGAIARRTAGIVMPPLVVTSLFTLLVSPNPRGVASLVLWGLVIGATYAAATLVVSRRSFLALMRS